MKSYLRFFTLLLIALAPACAPSPPVAPPTSIQQLMTSPVVISTGTPSQPITTVLPPLDTPNEIADLIFTGGTIITMDEGNPSAQAIAIRGDKIIAVGSDADVLRLRGQATKVIDLEGRTVTPGFIDSHSHRITQRYKWGFSTVEQAVQEALSQGWTEVTELAVDENQFNELRVAASQGKLHARVNVHLLANTFEGESLGDWYKVYKSGQQFGPYLRIAGLKIFIDYDSGRKLLFQQDELNEFVRQLQSEGWTISVKAISIQSHELALNAFEYALNGESNDLHRYRIEHSIAASDDQVARMARLGIIVCIQPSLPSVTSIDPDTFRMRDENGANNSYRWSDYQKAGVFLIASPLNPFPGVDEHRSPTHISSMGLLSRSVTQIGVGNEQPQAWMLEKSLTVEQILPMLTINGAYAAFAEDARGSLTAGKSADLVILSENPLQVESGRLKEINALMTMIGGKVEYCAAGAEAFCPSTVPSNTNTIPIGSIDIPVLDETISGTIEIAGWALDEIKIDRVEIYLDGQLIGNAAYGYPRPDVEHDYPGRPGTPNFGFIFHLNTTSYSNGSHTIEVFAINSSGNKSSLIPKKLTIIINN